MLLLRLVYLSLCARAIFTRASQNRPQCGVTYIYKFSKWSFSQNITRWGDRSPSRSTISGNGEAGRGIKKKRGKMDAERTWRGGVRCPPPDARRIGGPASAPGSFTRIFRARRPEGERKGARFRGEGSIRGRRERPESPEVGRDSPDRPGDLDLLSSTPLPPLFPSRPVPSQRPPTDVPNLAGTWALQRDLA